jgi:hypothetical protein
MSLSGHSPRVIATIALLAGAMLASGCGNQQGASPVSRADTAAYVAAAAGSVRVVAVGDIACAPGKRATPTTCRQRATARLATRLNPQLVLTLGDNQYESGRLRQFRRSYAKSWGKLLSRTRPTIGNHEYVTPGARGYYRYFRSRQPGAPGYYRTTAGAWAVYNLNSNCSKVSCATEAAWLDRSLAQHPTKCTVITMHHPRYSSGYEHGNNTSVQPLWAAAARRGVDIVLAGHDHDYERFVPMDAAGKASSAGMQEFVVGTGGKSLYHLGTRKAGSAYFQASTHGVLALDLRQGSYRWSYYALNGSVLDRGTRSCA